MRHEPRSRPGEYEDRWERAAAAQHEPLGTLRELQGDWRIERLSSLPPMPFVWKRIRGGRGETYLLPPSLPGRGLPFKLEQRAGYIALVYRPPLSFLVDELRLEADGSWLGRATATDFRYAWFRMLPMQSRCREP